MPTDLYRLRCRLCNQPVHWPPAQPRCPRPVCRGPLQPERNTVFDATLVEPMQEGMWRYRFLLPPLPGELVTLGEGWTPLLRVAWPDCQLYFKNESLNPTGSYKDRGAAMLINAAGGARIVMDDSSGNAGAALAAYAARAGLAARIFVPEQAPRAKIEQIARYGAQIQAVPGNRDDVSAAIESATTDAGIFYASHIWHPGYALALQTLAWEIWEQLGRRAPDWIVLPVGNGSLIRGIRWGFRSLQKGKNIDALPRLAAVQAANCAPLYAHSRGEYTRGHYQARPTLADGVAVPNPPLIDAMAAAVRKTGGRVLIVPEGQIRPAQQELARMGFYVEPTAALPYAALEQLRPSLRPDDIVVLLLTGHGFKSG